MYFNQKVMIILGLNNLWQAQLPLKEYMIGYQNKIIDVHTNRVFYEFVVIPRYEPLCAQRQKCEEQTNAHLQKL